MRETKPRNAHIRGNSTLIVLAILKSNPLHGKGITQQLEDKSGGSIRIGEATIYPILRELEEKGHITGEWQVPATTGVPRRVFTITEAGREEFDKELMAFERTARGIARIVGIEESLNGCLDALNALQAPADP